MTPLPHGQVIFAILEETPRTREELQLIFDEQYGADAQFTLCNHPNVDLDGLLTFLLNINKIVKEGDTYRLNVANRC